MALCVLNGHITKPCGQTGPGGLAKVFAINSQYIVSYTKDGCTVTGLTLQTTPTIQRFWRIELEGQDSYFTDATSDADAGAFYSIVEGRLRIAKTPKNRCVQANLYGSEVTFIIKYNSGIWEIVGLTGFGQFNKGLRYVQRIEGTFASGDKAARMSDYLLFRTEERITAGIQRFQVPIPDHVPGNVYNVGDIVYDSANQCYFIAQNSGVLSPLPACGDTNADWAWIEDLDAQSIANETYLAPLINP